MLFQSLHGKILITVFLIVLLIPESNLAQRAKRQVIFENEEENQVESSCRTPDGQSGLCVRFTSCRPFMQTVKRNRLHQYFCGFEGTEPMVCCPVATTRPARITTYRTTTTTSRPTTSRRPTTVRTTTTEELGIGGGANIVESRINDPRLDDASKPSFLPRECGESNSSHSRIVNGSPVQPGSWRWFAVVFVRQASGSLSPECGGVLVTRSHVVTAAHCLIDLKKNDINPSRISVRLGAHDLSVANEPGTMNVGVKEARIHERFERNNTFKNDIAVLKLSRSVDFTDTVAPVCLPYDSLRNDDLTDHSVFVAGFGTTSFNGRASDILLEASIKVQSQDICKKAYKDLLNTEITNVYMCAGKMDGSKDACQGDSGGPLLAVGKNRNFYLVGIVSFGKKCALPGYPGVYTRVTMFLDWLKEKLSY